MTILTSLRSLRGLSLVLTAAVFMLFAGSAAPHVAAQEQCTIDPKTDTQICIQRNDDICKSTNTVVAEKNGKLAVYARTTSTDKNTTLIMQINLYYLKLTTYANGIAAWVGPSSIAGLTSWWVMISKDTKITDSLYVVTVGQNMTTADGKATSSIEAVTGCGLKITPDITPYSAPDDIRTDICKTDSFTVDYNKTANDLAVYNWENGVRGSLIQTFDLDKISFSSIMLLNNIKYPMSDYVVVRVGSEKLIRSVAVFKGTSPSPLGVALYGSFATNYNVISPYELVETGLTCNTAS